MEYAINSLTPRINLKSQEDTIIGNENANSIEGNLMNMLININLNYLVNLVLNDQKPILFSKYCCHTTTLPGIFGTFDRILKPFKFVKKTNCILLKLHFE